MIPVIILSFLVFLPALAQPTGSARPESGDLLILGPVSGQSTDETDDPWDLPDPPGSMEIPRHLTPVYYCLDSFFRVPVRVHMSHDTLDVLLDEVGITPTLVLKSMVIQLSARANSKGERYSSMVQYQDDPVAWDQHQYILIEREIRSFKVMYDAFLTACAEEGLDPDLIHEELVDFGRELTAMGTSGELDPRHKAALRIFDGEDTTNPWLTD